MNFVRSHMLLVSAILIVVMGVLLVAVPSLKNKGEKPMLVVEKMYNGGGTFQKVYAGDLLREDIPSGCTIKAQTGYYIGWNSPKENGCRFEQRDKNINVDQLGVWDLIVYDAQGRTVHEYSFLCVN